MAKMVRQGTTTKSEFLSAALSHVLVLSGDVLLSNFGKIRGSCAG